MNANFAAVLLQAGGNPYSMLFIMVGMVVVMYFFMIRPQAKKAKEQKTFADTLNAGEKVVTTAGIHGTISRSNDDGTLKLEVGHGSFLTIERSAVSMEMTLAFRKRADAGVATTTK